MNITDDVKKTLVSVLPATREKAVQRLKGMGHSKASADQILSTGLWSGVVVSVKGYLSVVSR